MSKKPWSPWHKVVKLRDDLKSGELSLHLFAADLYEVMMQNGKRPIYEKVDSFFSLTFPTHNLRNLVRDVVLRLAGKNDKAVHQLELTYGGGKTHTLITMRHLVHDPAGLPDVPAVHEFTEAIGETPPQARVAALCFDKLDVETGVEVRSPDGEIRRLKHPWSVLAYQVAGDEGLSLLHAEGKPEERETPPAENTLSDLLTLPLKDGLGTLILLDEVLLFAKVKCRSDPGWLDIIASFFQYLTQAAAKVDRCCVVASLLSSEPKDQSDTLGKRIVAELYDIFQRQREEAVQPVEKDDVAEVLRRRLFDSKSIENRQKWRQQVIAALKGIQELDEATAKTGAAAEERYLKSFPFHPELTEVFYSKWAAGIDRFQKTRGALRTFALALREAGKWDECPLVGPSVFLGPPDQDALSESARELVAVADTIITDGQATRWTGILETELAIARQVQSDSMGLKMREIEQAAMATFLHSQPVGHSARTRDLVVVVAATRPDKIELEKGLTRWAQSSHWLDDLYTAGTEELPETWRLGNKPNLNQMHAVAAGNIQTGVVPARLIDEIARLKKLTAGASGAGVKVHTLPAKPKDVDDDGSFRFVVMAPSAACDSGKPSAETRRFLDENTGPDYPRVYRNAVLLLCPSRDGLEVAETRIADYLAWEAVRDELKKQEEGASIDAARMQTLLVNIDKAKRKIPEAIRQAYCTVVTVSDKNEVQAFKLTVTDDPHFSSIKTDKRARIKDSAVEASSLLPGGPYDLWKEGDTARRVKDLAGAFAQLPHLPKMLKADAIIDTLVDGCEQGAFVLRVTRPDGSYRTWWRSRPDEAAIKDPALELVLPEAAELAEIPPQLIAPNTLPELWTGNEIVAEDVAEYFCGDKVVQVDRGGYQEPVSIPKASKEVVDKAIAASVENGSTWLQSGPASILGESIPAGVLTEKAKLAAPPALVSAVDILPENLPSAWTANDSNALAIATALSQKAGTVLPWKTIRDAITGALQARFIELVDGSGAWPCEYHAAKSVQLKISSAEGETGTSIGAETSTTRPNILVADAELEPSEIQDLGDVVPQLLEIKAKSNIPIRFHVRVEIGDGDDVPPAEMKKQVNAVLKEIRDEFQVG